MTGDLSLSTLIDLVKREAPTISPPRMQELVKRLVITPDETDRYGGFNNDHYARNVVYNDEEVAIFLMCWKSGQRSLVHDHRGSLGGVRILRGILTETLFERAPNGMIKAVSSSDYQPSDIQIEEPTTIHQISNLQPVSNHAMSLHIYSPPLRQMNIYTLCQSQLKSVPAELYNFGLGI
jgi:cysteine dioxygenase